MTLFALTPFDYALIGALVAALAFALYAWHLAATLDRLRGIASDLVKMVTGGKVNNPFADHDRIAGYHNILIRQQREFGADAERVRRARCPSAPLSMRERWVLVAMGELNGEVVPSLDAIARKIGLSRELVGLIARTLAATGFAKLVALAVDQGVAAGRGYVLTPLGQQTKAAILAPYANRSATSVGHPLPKPKGGVNVVDRDTGKVDKLSMSELGALLA